MLLYEFEGKKLFKNCGIQIPKSQLLESKSQRVKVKPPLVLKAQVLSGYRAGAGGIIKIAEIKDLRLKIKELFKKTINNEKVERVLVEEAIEYEKEYYLSFSYSTETRGLVLTFGKGGSRVGSHFDEAAKNIMEKMCRMS